MNLQKHDNVMTYIITLRLQWTPHVISQTIHQNRWANLPAPLLRHQIIQKYLGMSFIGIYNAGKKTPVNFAQRTSFARKQGYHWSKLVSAFLACIYETHQRTLEIEYWYREHAINVTNIMLAWQRSSNTIFASVSVGFPFEIIQGW